MNKYALFYLTALLSSAPALASSIPALFPYAAQSHDPKGKVDMKGTTQITGTNHRVLDFVKKDNLQGKCDSGACSISGNPVPGLTLQWPTNWAFNEPWSGKLAPLPDFFENSAAGNALRCDWNNNRGITATSAVYQSVSVLSSCKIDAKQADVRIKGKVEITGSGTLTLAPGNYWMDELITAGSAGIQALPAGSINLYVKHKLDLASSKALGNVQNPVNITYYGQDDAEIKTQLAGNFNTHTHLTMSGTGNVDTLIQAKSIAMQGSAKVTLLPGSYWLEKLDLQGSAQIIQPQAGDINLHVKENVSIKIAKLGASDRRINIRNYQANVNLGENLTLYGDLFTQDELKLYGSSQLYGAVRAKKLDLQGSTQLHLSAGEYWFEDIKLQGSSKINLAGSTTLHIEDELELEGSSSINATNPKPLFIFVHGEKDDDDEGDVDVQGSSQIHGYLYVQGEVELQGSSKIYGAVNVVDLEMEGSSAIIYKNFSFAEQLDHYRLFYNSQDNKFQANACADGNCYLTYSQLVTELHIKNTLDNNASIVKFDSFKNQSLPTAPNNGNKLKQCVQLVIHKASPSPISTPALRCWKDGVLLADCKLCPDPQEPEALAGFVFGEITITEAHLKGLAAGASLTLGAITGNGSLIANGQSLITQGSSLKLPLTVSYVKAEVVEMQIKAKKGQQEQIFNLDLLFVPKSLAWVTASNLDCGANKKKFVYLDHAETCTVLGRAGSEVKLTLQAYGEADAQGKPRVIPNYQAGLGKIIQLQELSAAHQPYVDETDKDLLDLQFESKNGAGHELTYSVQQVGLIKATVPDSCAPYAISDNGCMLKTDGDTAIIGRTVPDSLEVAATQSGNITGDVVYAGKPGVSFEVAPSFTVVGLDTKGKALSSFSGEFAGGLKNHASFELSNDLDVYVPVPTFTENQAGKHVISFDTSELKFIKTEVFPETALDLPLKLTIANHDETQGIDGANTPLAQASDTLRFGFITLMDSEIKVGEAGTMASKLNYFGKDVQTVVEDKGTGYNLAQAEKVSHDLKQEPVLELGLAERSITVQPYDKQRKNIKVTVEGLPDWLKPADQDKAGKLTNPSAMLDILNNPRLRASDSTFNRREVFR